MKNTVTIIISFFLCILLFITEMLYLTLFNINNIATKKNIIELIDNIDVKKELIKTDKYNEVTNEVIDELFDTDEIEKYIKDNMKAIYLNTFYNENQEYISSNKVKDEMNTKLEILVAENKITESQKEDITKSINEITEEIDNSIEETNNDIGKKIIQTVVSKKTTQYILTGIIILSILIYLVNRDEKTLIWTGIPTFISGTLFFLLALSLLGKIDMIEMNINIDTYESINPFFNKITNSLKTSGLIMLGIGTIELIVYTILKFNKIESDNNGKI